MKLKSVFTNLRSAHLVLLASLACLVIGTSLQVGCSSRGEDDSMSEDGLSGYGYGYDYGPIDEN